jgi:hypothetical protein
VRLFINLATEESTSYVGVFYKESFDSTANIGREANTASDDDFFNGQIYSLDVTNNGNLQPADITTNLVTETCTDSACPTCPIGGGCLSLCTLGTFSSGPAPDACTNCDGACTNCKDASTGCELCHDPLCTECNDFSSTSKCGACQTTNVAHTGSPADTCECDATHVYDSVSKTCTCSTECTTCSALDAFHCMACADGYNK